MFFDAIAVIILLGMMLVPVVNIVVGVIAGALLVGPAGAPVGLALAILIMGLEKQFADQGGWFRTVATSNEITSTTWF
jgi:hypothetical protein